MADLGWTRYMDGEERVNIAKYGDAADWEYVVTCPQHGTHRSRWSALDYWRLHKAHGATVTTEDA